MAYVPAQTKTVINSDITALTAQLTAAQTARKALPDRVNPLDIQHLDKQIKQLKAVLSTAKLRAKRAP